MACVVSFYPRNPGLPRRNDPSFKIPNHSLWLVARISHLHSHLIPRYIRMQNHTPLNKRSVTRLARPFWRIPYPSRATFYLGGGRVSGKDSRAKDFETRVIFEQIRASFILNDHVSQGWDVPYVAPLHFTNMTGPER